MISYFICNQLYATLKSKVIYNVKFCTEKNLLKNTDLSHNQKDNELVYLPDHVCTTWRLSDAPYKIQSKTCSYYSLVVWFVFSNWACIEVKFIQYTNKYRAYIVKDIEVWPRCSQHKTTEIAPSWEFPR